MSFVDNLISGAATTGGVAIAKNLADGKSSSVQTAAPYIGGALMAYAIGRYQDQNGKMGSMVVTGLTGVAGALSDTLLKKNGHLATATQTLGTVIAATAANWACERYLNV